MAFYFSPSKHHPLVPLQGDGRDSSSPLLAAHQRVANRNDTPSNSGLSLISDQWSSSDLEVDANQEWVVFSPQLLSSRGGEEDFSSSGYDMNNDNEIQNDGPAIRPNIISSTNINNPISLKSASEADDSNDQNEEDDITPEGALTPLAFPTHNGSGMFLPEASDLTDRVNAWRLSQSQLVLQEMKRLERKFFHGGNGSGWMATSISTVQPDGMVNESIFTNSGIESFGLNGNGSNILNSFESEPHSQPEEQQKSSFWATIRDFIGINDQVLEVIFGERCIEEEEINAVASNSPKPAEPSTTISDHQVQSHFLHYNQALLSGPLNWEANMITRLFQELKIPLPPEISFLRYLGSQLLAFTHPELSMYSAPPSPTRPDNLTTFNQPNNNQSSNTRSFRTFSTHTDSLMERTFPANYWEDGALSVSSNYWEQSSSVSSTPVW